MAKTDTKTVSIVLLLYFLVVSGLIFYIITKYREEYTRCNIINKNTNDNINLITAGAQVKLDTNMDTAIWSDGTDVSQVDIPCLVNYKIKTAYNCCAVNSFKNSFVSDCALKHCIQSGAKCLDFEIYSVEGKPVVGLSSRETNINMKESYNKLDFFKAMKIVNSQMSSNSIKNANKELPMIIHLRMKTKNRQVYDIMARDIYNAFQNKLLDSKFSYLNQNNIKDGEQNTLSIRDKPLIFQKLTVGENQGSGTSIHHHFRNKVIIIVNVKSIFNISTNEPTVFEQFLEKNGQPGMLLNYANLIIPSRWADQKNDVEIITSSDKEAFKIDTQDKLYFTSPLVSNSSKNVNFVDHHNLGFQMVGLSFQNFKYSRDIDVNEDLTEDSQIAKYHKIFKNEASYIRKIPPPTEVTLTNEEETSNLVKYFYTSKVPTSQAAASITYMGFASDWTS